MSDCSFQQAQEKNGISETLCAKITVKMLSSQDIYNRLKYYPVFLNWLSVKLNQ